MITQRFSQNRLRRNVAGWSAAIYLWSLLFAVFGHNHLLVAPPPPRHPSQSVLRLANPDHQAAPCAACTWDQCAGHALAPPVFCLARPTLPPLARITLEVAWAATAPRAYASRGPPSA